MISRISRLWRPTAFAVLAGIAAGPCCAAEPFVKSSINLPSSITGFEINNDLDGDGRNDLLVVYQRRLLVFFQSAEGRFSAAPDVEIGGEKPIPDKYCAVSVGKVASGSGMQLLLLGRAGVDSIDFAAMKSGAAGVVDPRPLIQQPLDISSDAELAYLNCAVDMDGDGNHEVVAPVDGALAVFSRMDGFPFELKEKIQLPRKTYEQASLDKEPLLLGSSFFNQPGNGGNVSLLPDTGLWQSIRFMTSEVTKPAIALDYNRNGRMDFLGEGYILTPQDGKSPVITESEAYAKIVNAVLPHESRNLLVRVPNLADFNGDKSWDTYTVNVSTAKLSPRTDVGIYLGNSQHEFPAQPSQVLRTRDFAYSDAIPVGDINGDGALDLALLHLDFQASSMQSQLKAYLKKGLDGDLRFYLWDKTQNRYPDAPSFKQPVTVNYEIYGARQFFRQQIAINQDMTGDGLPDLVIKTGGTEFSIFENREGKGFDRSPYAQISTAPTHFSSLQCADLNQDGKGDVIISGYVEDQDDRQIYSIYTSAK